MDPHRRSVQAGDQVSARRTAAATMSPVAFDLGGFDLPLLKPPMALMLLGVLRAAAAPDRT
jgi:hypothetical protein